jgi:hypothetical protein
LSWSSSVVISTLIESIPTTFGAVRAERTMSPATVFTASYSRSYMCARYTGDLNNEVLLVAIISLRLMHLKEMGYIVESLTFLDSPVIKFPYLLFVDAISFRRDPFLYLLFLLLEG